MLHEVAETSDGISNIEMEEIKRISEKLGIKASVN
jgi:signal recognition particle subunit SEC65